MSKQKQPCSRCLGTGSLGPGTGNMSCPQCRGIGTLPASTSAVNHPAHYNSHPSGVECITVVEHFGFNVGNAIKYLSRWREKGGVEDLRKARHYIDKLIELYTPGVEK